MVNKLDPRVERTEVVTPVTVTSAVDDEADRKKRRLIYYIALILLLLAAIYYFANYPKDADGTDANGTASVSNPETITDLARLTAATEAGSVTGTNVDITAAPVVEVIGDRSFTLGSNDSRVYALLDESLNDGSTEQVVKVESGKSYHIVGNVVAAPTDKASIMTTFGFSDAQATALQEKGFYVAVSKVE